MSDAQTKSHNKDLNKKGEYVRPESGFRQRITADGSSGFKAEKG
jgi:glutathionyl-hydroquinone reductase